MAKKKDSKPYFVLQLALKTEKWQEDIIDKRLEAGRKIYNSLVSISLKRLREMEKTKKYRSLKNLLNHDKDNSEHDKKIFAEIKAMREEFGLTEYGLSGMITGIRQHFKKHIGAHIAQKLSKRLWQAFEKYFFGDGRETHFCKYEQLNSLEGKDNKTGIRYIADSKMCIWSNLKMPIVIDEQNSYEMEALQMPVAYCRIVRKFVRQKRKYYIQIVFKGNKPAKRRKSDGSFVLKLGNGDVGIDIGTATAAYAAETEVSIKELADRVQNIDRKRRLIQRKMDRSKRAMNPENFNEDGTIKKGRHKWLNSNRYKKLKLKLKDLYRKQKEVRKLQHEMLANHLLSLGNKFFVEKMNFKGLQKKAKNTEKNDKGKFKRKKRFGKSIGNRAPAMFISILKRKLSYFGVELKEINTVKAKASQFNHIDKIYTKKSLGKRWNDDVNGYRVQRDMYSAFLIRNINNDLETFNLDKCNKRFNSFIKMHNMEIENLLGKKNLSSIGI